MVKIHSVHDYVVIQEKGNKTYVQFQNDDSPLWRFGLLVRKPVSADLPPCKTVCTSRCFKRGNNFYWVVYEEVIQDA